MLVTSWSLAVGEVDEALTWTVVPLSGVDTATEQDGSQLAGGVGVASTV